MQMRELLVRSSHRPDIHDGTRSKSALQDGCIQVDICQKVISQSYGFFVKSVFDYDETVHGRVGRVTRMMIPVFFIQYSSTTASFFVFLTGWPGSTRYRVPWNLTLR